MGIMSVHCCGGKSRQDQICKSVKVGKASGIQLKDVETMEVSITLDFRKAE